MTDVIDLVLPCLNEAAALPWVLSHLPDGYHAIVADNGSSDDSAEIATAFGADVVHVTQRGFGAAAHGGLLASTSAVVCFMDADGSCDPRQLDRVTEPVRDGRADLMLGRRRPTASRVWPWHAQAGNALISARLRQTTGISVHDIGPMRAARREALLALELRDRRFGYPLEMVVAAAHAGWAVQEVDVDYAPRCAGGRSKVTGTLTGTLLTIADMAQALNR